MLLSYRLLAARGAIVQPFAAEALAISMADTHALPRGVPFTLRLTLPLLAPCRAARELTVTIAGFAWRPRMWLMVGCRDGGLYTVHPYTGVVLQRRDTTGEFSARRTVDSYAVWCVLVLGNYVYCGLFSGAIQRWEDVLHHSRRPRPNALADEVVTVTSSTIDGATLSRSLGQQVLCEECTAEEVARVVWMPAHTKAEDAEVVMKSNGTAVPCSRVALLKAARLPPQPHTLFILYSSPLGPPVSRTHRGLLTGGPALAPAARGHQLSP